MDESRAGELLGTLAVRAGFCTRSQLDACLRQQPKDKAPVGELLVRRGVLRREQMETLLAAQRRVLTQRAADGRLGERAVAKGLLTREALGQALRDQADAWERGEEVRLGEILVARGAMRETAVRGILRDSGIFAARCPRCGASYNIRGGPPSDRTLCRQCHVPLVGDADPSDLSATATLPAGTRAGTVAFPPTRTPGPSPAANANTDAKDKPAKSHIGNVRILRELGRGAMGIVYQGIQEPIARPCALKILSNPSLRDPKLVERFLREARSLARLRHPNLLTLYEAGTDDGVPYLVMELARGSTLEAVIQEKTRLPLRRAARLLVQVCEALGAAHAQGLIHRDVKPENILVDDADHVMVSDFGLAHIEGHGPLTETGAVVGSPAYMSPEQASARAVDLRTDIYGAGATLYEAVTGQPPVSGADIYEVLKAAEEGKIAPPRRLVPSLPERFERVLLRALERRPEDRYPDMASFAEAMRPFAGATRSPGIRPRRRIPRLAASAGALAGVLLSAAFVAAFLRDDEPARTPVPPSAPPREPDRTALAREAAAAAARGDWATAASGWERIYSLEPDPGVGLRLADAYLRLHQDARALDLLKPLAGREGAPETILLLARAYARLGRRTDAVNAMATLTGREIPVLIAAEILMLHGQILERDGDREEACARFEKAASLWRDRREWERVLEAVDGLERMDGATADTLFFRGLAFVDLGRGGDAERAFQAVLQRNPDHAGAHANLGIVYKDRGDETRSLAELDHALSLDPEYLSALANRAIVRMNRREYEGAATDLASLRNIASDYAILPLLEGSLEYSRGRPADAIRNLTAALRTLAHGVNHAEALFLRAECLLRTGQPQAAAQDLASYLQRYPDGTRAQVARGRLAQLQEGQAPPRQGR
ncbi:MAG: protein kinase [Planctomycetes bacterium]|nr:protein kinase [Planctomycetota bacterium]